MDELNLSTLLKKKDWWILHSKVLPEGDSEKCVPSRETRNSEKQGHASYWHQVAVRMLNCFFEVKLGFLPFNFSTLCSKVTITKHSFRYAGCSFFFLFCRNHQRHFCINCGSMFAESGSGFVYNNTKIGNCVTYLKTNYIYCGANFSKVWRNFNNCTFNIQLTSAHLCQQSNTYSKGPRIKSDGLM